MLFAVTTALFFAAWCVYNFSGVYSDQESLVGKFSIVLTHFQISSIYIKFNLKYPRFALRIIDWISSVFSFSIVVDIASPECSVRGVGFSQRWWST